MGNPMGAKGSVMIFVPLLEVIWKKEWPNHWISRNPEAAARTRRGLSFKTRFGFLQAASTWLNEAKGQRSDNISINEKSVDFLFIIDSF